MSASTERKNRQAAREAGTDKKMLAAEKEAKEKAKSSRRWTIGTIAVIVSILAIIVLDSNVLYKSTAFTVGDTKYNASEVSYEYANQYNNFASQYGSYASIFGLDTSNGAKGLDKQDCSFTEGTWKDYFLDAARQSMIQATALCDYANANGIELDEDEIANVNAGFEGVDEMALSYGYANGDKLFAANYGPGVNTEMVRSSYMKSALGTKVLQTVSDSFQYTDAELEEHYKSFNGDQDLFDYCYYYVPAETVEVAGEDGETTQEVNEDTVAMAKAQAEAIVMSYNEDEGEDTAAKFDAAVKSIIPEAEATEQTRVVGSSLIAADWMKDASRQAGDITVESDSSETGYYVVAFLGRDDNHYKVAQVRHILVKAEASEDGSYTEEAKAAAKAKAEDILAEYMAGDKTEESFAALAEQYSEDAGSNTNGGLYATVTKGQTVPEFDQFCFEGHKAGDTAIVYGDNGSYAGYHVMYYVGEGELYSKLLAENDLRNADLTEWLENLVAGYESSEGFGMKLVG